MRKSNDYFTIFSLMNAAMGLILRPSCHREACGLQAVAISHCRLMHRRQVGIASLRESTSQAPFSMGPVRQRTGRIIDVEGNDGKYREGRVAFVRFVIAQQLD